MNHLDTESMEWLEGWLRGHKGAVVAVSHDRRFLENMAEQIAELEHGRLTLYPCGYDRYLLERQWARERLERTAEEQRRRVEETLRFVDRFRYKSSKAAQVQSHLKRLEKTFAGAIFLYETPNILEIKKRISESERSP